MKIDIDNVVESGVTITADERSQVYDFDTSLVPPNTIISVKVFAQFVAKRLVVRGQIYTNVHFECSRCLNTFQYHVDIPEYTFDCTAQKGDIIDLTDTIREHIIIALPMKPLCSSRCKGICPNCGEDLNSSSCTCSNNIVDERFKGLDKLKFE